MRRLPAVTVLVLAAAAASASGDAQTTTAAGQTVFSPPALVAPLQTALTPVLFQWTPVAPGTGYRLRVSSNGRTVQQTTVSAASYEVQISDQYDVGSHVLFDRIVEETTLIFDNRNVPGSGFTIYQPPARPLSAGTVYYWRVRARFAGPVSPWSSPPGQFTLLNGPTTTPFHDLAVVSVAVPGYAVTGLSTPVIARVQNVGTFSETVPEVDIAVDGVVIGRLPGGATLRPNEYVDVRADWIPHGSRVTSTISAMVKAVDDNAENNGPFNRTVFLVTRKPVQTATVGTLVEQDGKFALIDGAGHTVATVRADRSRVDLTRFTGKRVRILGALAAEGSQAVVTATSAELAP